MSIKKVRKLENNVLQPIEWGTTKISYNDLPRAEQALFEKVWKIIDAHKYNDTAEIEPWEMKLMDEASRILWTRAIDVFNTVVGHTIHREDPMGKMLWNMWFGFFMDEMCEAIPQRIQENEIYDQKGKTWKQKRAEADKLYETWVRPFSEKRLHAYVERLLSREPKKTRKKKVKT